jgi:hypothetical protein
MCICPFVGGALALEIGRKIYDFTERYTAYYADAIFCANLIYSWKFGINAEIRIVPIEGRG